MRVNLILLPLFLLSCDSQREPADAEHLYRYEFPMLTDGCYKRFNSKESKCPYRVYRKPPLACEGTVCRYLSDPLYMLDDTRFANVILVYRPGIKIQYHYHVGMEYIKAAEGDLLDQVSGRVTYRSLSSPTGRTMYEFKDAPVILMRVLEYRASEECECDDEDWPRE